MTQEKKSGKVLKPFNPWGVSGAIIAAIVYLWTNPIRRAGDSAQLAATFIMVAGAAFLGALVGHVVGYIIYKKRHPEDQVPVTVEAPSTPVKRQLVNQNCVICGQRISLAFTARFCPECTSPVHNACLERVAGDRQPDACKTCGAKRDGLSAE